MKKAGVLHGVNQIQKVCSYTQQAREGLHEKNQITAIEC